MFLPIPLNHNRFCANVWIDYVIVIINSDGFDLFKHV